MFIRPDASALVYINMYILRNYERCFMLLLLSAGRLFLCANGYISVHINAFGKLVKKGRTKKRKTIQESSPLPRFAIVFFFVFAPLDFP